MTPIGGKAKTLRELLKGVKYSIDYYQREYRWEAKQLLELLNDLSGMFLKEYEPGIDRKRVADFPHYFLGSIIISQKETQRFIVDGQQRLTSLTLLLVLLRSLQRDSLRCSERRRPRLFGAVRGEDVQPRRRRAGALHAGTL